MNPIRKSSKTRSARSTKPAARSTAKGKTNATGSKWRCRSCGKTFSGKTKVSHANALNHNTFTRVK